MDKDVSQLGAGFEVVLQELHACTVEAVSEAVPELRACVRAADGEFQVGADEEETYDDGDWRRRRSGSSECRDY